MKCVIITNSFNRNIKLVERSLIHSLKLANQIEKLYFIDQNEKPLELSKEITENSKIKIIHRNVTCVSKARNLVELNDNIDWVIFCDDDGYIDSNYINVLKDVVEKNKDINIIAGSIVRDDNGEYYSPRHKIGGDLNLFRNTKLLMGSNFCVTAKAFNELHKFDEDFGAGGFWGAGEETDFAWNAHFSNQKMAYERSLIVYHIPPYCGSLKESIQKAYRYGIAKGALVSKWILRKKLKVFYEFFEMLFIPLIQVLASFFLLKWNLILVYLSSLIGRVVGLVKGLIYYLKRI